MILNKEKVKRRLNKEKIPTNKAVHNNNKENINASTNIRGRKEPEEDDKEISLRNTKPDNPRTNRPESNTQTIMTNSQLVKSNHIKTTTFPALVTMLTLLSYAKYITWLTNYYKQTNCKLTAGAVFTTIQKEQIRQTTKAVIGLEQQQPTSP